MREPIRAWLAAHSMEVATVAFAGLVAWMVVKAGGELLVWWRARRHAAIAGVCASCGGVVEVMTYPPDAAPVGSCEACLDRSHEQLEGTGVEPSRWVPVARPDLLYLAGAVAGPLLAGGLLVLVLADVSRSAT